MNQVAGWLIVPPARSLVIVHYDADGGHDRDLVEGKIGDLHRGVYQCIEAVVPLIADAQEGALGVLDRVDIAGSRLCSIAAIRDGSGHFSSRYSSMIVESKMR